MSKKLKDEYASILVYKSDDGINYVEFIDCGYPLDYSFYGVSFNDTLDVGFLSDTNFKSLDEYTSTQLKNFKDELDATVKELLTDGYYESTNDFVIEYQELAKQYYDIYNKLEKGYKKFSKTPLAIKYKNFFKEHPNLISGLKVYLDPRFMKSTFYKTRNLNGIESKVLALKEPKSHNKESYIQEIKTRKKDLIRQQQLLYDDLSNTLNEDYNDLINVAKKLLENHDKVGLIGYYNKGHMINRTPIKIDEFSQDDYVKVKKKYIYWFTK